MPDNDFDPPLRPDAPRAVHWLQALKEADARRPDLPGEQWVVLGLGVVLLLSASRGRSVLTRLLRAAAGGALVGRAVSRSDGVARLAGTVATFAGRRTER